LEALNTSLELARYREDVRLTALVAQIAVETGHHIDDRPHRTRVADGRALRGLPAIGANSAGSAIAGTQPGSDEHLERLG
jgi:hypothetical protein